MLLATVLIAPCCFGWGGTGHQIVALIAEDRLSDQAVAGIRDLLGKDHISDAVIANWADEIRRERRDTAGWHYVDIPVEVDRFDQKRDGNDGRNVIDDRGRRVVTDRCERKRSTESRGIEVYRTSGACISRSIVPSEITIEAAMAGSCSSSITSARSICTRCGIR
jgi:hypothetical protein